MNLAVHSGGFVDCHLHTAAFSCDAQATLAEYVARAPELGLRTICTTEHVDFDPRDMCYGHYDYPRHRALREQVRAEENRGVEVLIGAEVDYQHRFADEIRTFVEAAEYDFVIGSVHYARGEPIFEPEFLRTPERPNYLAYLEEAAHAVRSGLFDVLGHLDIVKRYGTAHYGPFDPAAYAEEIDAVLRACIDTRTGLEINSSGWRGPPREPFPSLRVLRRYRELGGEILTIGSDAHTAADLAAGVPQAFDLARAAGWKAIAVFRDRQPVWLPIDT